jgi:hypothetical protein
MRTAIRARVWGGKAIGLALMMAVFASAAPLQAVCVGYTQQGTKPAVGSQPFNLATADLNADGKADIVTPNVGGNNVSVLLGNGDGTFATRVNYSSLAVDAVALGDFNGDGKPDLAIAASDLKVRMNNGSGAFGNAASYPTPSYATGVAVGDFNGDGKLDLVTSNFNTGDASVFLNNGTGTFATAVTYPAHTSPYAIAVGDVTGDGKLDLVVANRDSNDVSLIRGIGNGTFGATSNYPAGTAPFGITTGDFNNDGRADVAVANHDSADVSVLISAGATLGSAASYNPGVNVYNIITADFDADGKVDIGTVSVDSNRAYILLGTGTGTFGTPSSYFTSGSSNPNGIGAADYNNDGRLDFATANYTAGNVSIFLNTCVPPPTITDVSPVSGPATGGQAVTITGTLLTGATSVKFGATNGTITNNTATSITVTSPAHAVGAVNVVVTTPGGTATATNAYTYLAVPTITTVAPTAGPIAGGQTGVVITGTSLTGASAVTFGGTAATITGNTSTSITVTTPAHAAGTVDVAVTVTLGSVTSTGAYTYADVPTFTSMNPTSGPAGGGQAGVVLTGTNLATASAVTFGGTAATITNKTATTVTVTTPAHAAGAVNVVVTTGGGSATLTNGYTYIAAPTFTSVAPTSGPLAGGQTGVVITGTSLSNASSVTFGGTAATITNNTATTITVTTPAHATGTVSIVVTTPGGSVTGTNVYSYVGLPTITSIAPTSGPAAGGQTGVVITGLRLSNASSVTFGGTAATITNNTSTTVTVTTPAHAAGAVDVVVTTPGGSVTSTNGYTYIAAPAITSVSPALGPASGGQTGVVITGTTLSSATSVKFGGTTATITNNTATTITITTPAHAAGAVDVVVTTAGGTATSTNGYTYVAAPTIGSVSPNAGPAVGGQTGVVISGTNLSSATGVTFGGTAATITNNTAGAITVTTPAHAAGAVNVVVATAGGSATSTNGYTYVAAPTTTTVSPNAGPAAGGQSGVVISGTNLSSATGVTFGGAAATITGNTAGSITVTTPAHAAGAVDVVVTTAGGSATSMNGYTYVAAPALMSVSPNSGPAAGGQTGVQLGGANLANATSVTFGGSAATITGNAGTTITVTTPAHAAGAVDVVVTTAGGSATSMNGYTFVAAPSLTTVSPNSGSTAGGQTGVVISGTNLSGATSVTFGGTPATITNNGAGSTTVTTPAHAAGLVDVVVTTAGGSATASNAYTYVPPPSIAMIAPGSGPVTGGQPVTITGTNLANAGSVTFGGTPATITNNTAGSITVTTPIHLIGAVTVVVTTIGGTDSGAYTYVAGPAVRFAVTAPAAATAGTAFNVTVTALDAFDNTADGYSGNVHFTSSDGAATLPPDSTLTGGTGTFSATLRTSGSRTITATDGAVTGTSNAINVGGGAATHFAVSAPASATAGSAFSFTVTALDAFNNTATGYAGTVHFTSSDGAPTLPVDSTLTSGTGTFSATLRIAGSQTLTAADGGITGTSGTIDVAPAAATHFAVSAPASATAGGAFSFTVTALDTFNNIATGYAGTVHFTSSDASATLPMDSSLTGGTGSFSATLRVAGPQTITATGGVVTGTSGTINVAPTAATHFAVSAPASATAGSAFTFTVTALDVFNNTATGYAGVVLFDSSDPTATVPDDSTLTNGTATFSATLRVAGPQTIAAADVGVTGTSNTIFVAPAAATHFTVSAPASATAGAAFSFNITAFDAFNNIATGYGGTAHFSSSDGAATLPVDSPLTGGTGSFTATLRTSGSRSISAVDGAVGGTSGTINVAPAAVTNFALSAPASATAGSAFSFTVTALDTFNNTASAYSGTAHFTSSDGAATLPTDSMLTGGTGTFSATLRTSGSRTITGTDGAITGTSNAINVSAGAATHFAVSAPASATAGSAFSFTVTALDAFNNIATGYAGVVLFDSSDPTANVPDDSTLTNGTATFSATLRVAGPQTITAVDNGITGTSNPINVTPASATHFTLSAPASATAGAAFGFTVTALDAFNNTATGYNGTAHFTSSDGTATLPADSTLTNGAGSFSATLRIAASHTITATDGPIIGTSAAINLAPAAATYFTVSAPASATAGGAFSFTVTAFDAFNNIATGYAGSAHFTSSDGSATLPGDSTLTGGIGTFSATLRTAAAQTITAADGAIAGTSGPINVTHAATTHFVVVAPATATAGSPLSFTVTAFDAFNNPATGYAGTVHFTSSDATATLPSDSTLTNGSATFSATLRVTGTQTIAAADGAITGTTGAILVGPSTATHFTVSAPAAATAGSAFTFTVTALDAFNNIATGYSGTAHFTSSDGSAILPADSTLTGGTGSFSATLRTAGGRTITATEGAITGTSNAVNVTPAAATHFAVVAPAMATAGSSFSVTVTALDAFDNTATGYAGTVHFTSSDATATLAGDSTLSAGTGTFSATLRVAGLQTVAAADGGITGTSGTINVAPAAATHFTVSAPASATAGAAFSVNVTALDAFNNIATGYSGSVHFTSSDGTATLPADSPLTNGAGAFSATLRMAAPQTITATDGPITGTSNAISVAPAAATHFTVSAPAAATAGSAFSFTVTALDAFNNTATGYSGTAHFTSSDTSGTLPTDSTLTNGAGTFSATLRTAASQTLTATDGTITGTSNAINVGHGAATRFTVSAPATATAGGALSFTVTAFDAFNNPAVGYAGTVHFTSSDATATLPSDTLTHGSGTFSATLRVTGSQTITATDGAITGTTGAILVGPSTATHFTLSAPASATAGSAFNFTVTALDAFNNIATGYTGTAHFTSSDGSATLPGDNTLTNGAGSFSATLRTAGGRTITATDGAITGTSNAINVTPAAATHFAVAAPAMATAGNSLSFTVTALDAFNNIATGYAGTVHFTTSDATATLAGDNTLTAGSGSFSATLRVAAPQTITAADGGITGTSGTINVAPAAATHFTVTAPASATAGTAFTFTVTALDAFNNLATGYAGTMHFTSSDATATLPANSPLTNGTGSFSATLRVAASQAIAATDGPVTGSSNAIDVAPAAATHFTVSTPASATAGSTFTFTVTALDAFNNTATSYPGTAHFTSSDATATLPADSTLTNGAGTFSATLRIAAGQTITAADGPITGTSNAINVGHGPTTRFTVTAPPTATAGSPFSFTVTAFDPFNNIAIGYAGTIHFTSSDSAATLPANSPMTNGTGSFMATLRSVAGQTLTATDGAITGTSNSIGVGHGATTHFTVTAPATTTAGSVLNFTVTALDAFDNIATGYSGAPHFASSDGTATLSANSTLTDGAGTFNATLRLAGSQTITATDGGITGSSNAIVVAPATATLFTLSAPATATAGNAISFTVTALDAFNNIATGYGGTAHFTSSDATATLPIDSALSNGIGTFSATLRTAGSQSVTATDNAITGTSNTIDVAPAAATHFALSAPGSATAGNAIIFTVTALDAFDNTATAYAGTAHFTSSDPSATMPSDSTVSSGTGTFSATLRLTGPQTLGAAEGAVSGTSSAINVAPAAATHFTLSTPASAIAGNVFSLTVTALDAFNNIATGYGGAAHFTSSDGAATLPADSILSNGAGTFNATLRVAGSQTISAAEGAVAGTSSAIAVAPASATHFEVLTPASATAGNALSVTVTALDAFNNTATGYAGTVHFTSSDTAATLPADGTLTNGVGTFSATLRTAGVRTVAAADGAIAGISKNIDVAAATTTHFRVTAPAAATAGNAFPFTVTPLDAFENIVSGFDGAVHVTSSDAGATLPADAVAGTFSATLRTAGNQTLTATAGALTGTSNAIAVAPGAAASFQLSAPASATAGSPFTFTVVARDAFSNVATAYAGSLHFTSGDAQATLPADAGLTAGTGTFTATLRSAGTGSIAASDGPLTGNAALAVNPAAADHFAVEAAAGGSISSQVAGAAFAIRVVARDPFGNLDSAFAGSVTLTTSAGSIAPASISFAAADAGVKSATVTVTQAGTGKTITATAGAKTGTSNSFAVTAGPLHHFRVEAAGTGAISTQIANVPFAIRITALDANDNVVLPYNGNVVISSTASLLTGGGATPALTNGVLASHLVSLASIGSATVTATNGAFSGTSNPFAVGAGADLSVSLTGSTSTLAGAHATYTLVVHNAGPSTAHAPAITLALPANWQLTAASAPCGSGFPCTAADLDPSSTLSIQITVLVPAGSAPATYDVTAAASSTTLDPSLANNQATAQTNVSAVACPDAPSGLQPSGTQSPAAGGTLRWAANGAQSYEVYLGPVGSGCNTFVGETTGTSFDYHGLTPGNYQWRVIAKHVDCPEVASACVTFEAVADCVPPADLILSAVAEISSGAAYRLEWNDAGAESYQLQESTDASFANPTTFSTTALSLTFQHEVQSVTSYYYRVRAVVPCLGQLLYTRGVRIVIQPRISEAGPLLNLMVQKGSADILSQMVHVDMPAAVAGSGKASEAAFVATSDQPWLTVNPPSGTLLPAGLDVMLTVNAAGRIIGTNVATVHLATADGAPLGDVRVNLHVGAVMSSQPRSVPIPSNAVLLPAVAHAPGVNTRWQSDVRLFNPASVPVAYQLAFTPSNTEGIAGGTRVDVEIPAGATVAFDDVVRHLFGYGAFGDESAIGSLEVRPLTGAGRAVVTSRTYAVTPDGTYGQAIPAFPLPSFAGFGGTLSLQHLAQSAAYRTNVGLVEASGQKATARLRVYDSAGHELTHFDVSLGRLEQRQLNSVLADHGVTADDARIAIEVTSPQGLVGAYASVVDNRTADPTLVPAVQPSQISATRYVVPGVADFNTGRNSWRTDLRIYNAAPASVAADVTFFPQGSPDVRTKQVTIAAGETKTFDSIVRTLFGTSDIGGAVHVVTPALSSLIVTARTYDAKGEGTYGQFIPAVTPPEATALGERPLEILHLEQTTAYRANAGFVELTGKSAQLQVTATLADGRTATTLLDLAPYEFRQIGSMLQTLGFPTATNARLTLRVVGGAGRVTGYASIIDNRTGDPTYMSAQ